MESTQIIDTPAERLVAGYQRARKIWGPFHVVWADLEGRVHWAQPHWCPSVEIALEPHAMSVAQARQILDELERRAPAETAWAEIERRSRVMSTTARTLGRPGAA